MEAPAIHLNMSYGCFKWLAVGLQYGRKNGLKFVSSAAGLYGLNQLLARVAGGDFQFVSSNGTRLSAGPWAILAIGAAFALARWGGKR